MPFSYLDNIPLDQACREYTNTLIKNAMESKSEKIAVAMSAGRTTAGPVYARINAPHYNASAMDGIALNARLTFGASETTPVILTSDQFKRLNTGDPLPENCDCVIMIEDVIEMENGAVKIYEASVPWQHIRQIGEDICAGEMILQSFSKITPSALGAMIAGGVTHISVIKRPKVGIIPTGDEIVPPEAEPKEGDILEFNSAIFSAMLQEWGAETKTYPIVKDNLEQICKALELAMLECDIIILNAGSSAGSEDYSAQAIAKVGTVLYHGLAIKPGKPAILGYSGSKPILGVPGYPVSGIIVIEQVLRPIIGYLCKAAGDENRYTNASLSKAVVSTLKYQEFVRVRMGYVGERLIASPLSRGSGIVTSFMKADGIVEVPQGVEGYQSGENVRVRLLRSEEQLRNSLVVIGSHDPLLDELAELLRIEYGDISMGSAHVGSMGGILAIRRGEAHVAGTHLLDVETGRYNTAFVRKMLPRNSAKLVECVSRTQGIIVQKGNPKNIKSIADLTQSGLRYINRQKGSGTRILIDYLCEQGNIDTYNIYGYDREEYTHTSVAALIYADSADAGLGVYSASKLYDLDFIEICEEQYDLLVANHAWELPMVQKLIEILRSDKFVKRLDALGGYTTKNPGTIREII